MTLFPRSSGILLHPTSLPGRHGIGDLGDFAYRFVDYLQSAGQTAWQVLPLGPTGYGDSPYQCLSAFAGNPNLISLDKLVEDGWLDEEDFDDRPPFDVYHVEYGPVIDYHITMLDLAYTRFKSKATDAQKQAFAAWREENASWLDDWVVFIALKKKHGGKPWVEWPEGEALAEPDTIKAARAELADAIDSYAFRQWLFFNQWGALKAYANERGVRLVGDLPIFVAHDSSDVWGNRDLFYLDPKGNPTVIAGVPPDYFSESGQRWGNPLYRWDVMESRDYAWWISRMTAILELVDLVRIDHFRGFEAYWEIDASEETAINGKWVPGPGVTFFHALRNALGDLPIIAEDLGEITREVVELRDSLGLPGMLILQFAWSDPENLFLPHNHVPNRVVYTGTHDNNTTLGWWMAEAGEHGQNFVREYINQDVQEPHWTLMRLAMMSCAHTCIVPMQDVLGYGGDTRMNTPGKEAGNWGWRFSAEMMNHESKDRLAHLTWLYRRRPDQQEVKYGDVAKRTD